MSAYIEFQDVKKVYKMGEVSIEALAGVSFSIDQGEFVVIAGASGAGKKHDSEYSGRYGFREQRHDHRGWQAGQWTTMPDS